MQNFLLVDTERQSCSAAWQQLLLGSFCRTDRCLGAVCLTRSSSQLSQHSVVNPISTLKEEEPQCMFLNTNWTQNC